MTTNHTPGPWRLDAPRIGPDNRNLITGDYHSIDAGCGYYAHDGTPGFGITGMISKADAAMMVAAPALFDALTQSVAAFDAWRNSEEDDGSPDPEYITQARQALSQAKP